MAYGIWGEFVEAMIRAAEKVDRWRLLLRPESVQTEARLILQSAERRSPQGFARSISSRS